VKTQEEEADRFAADTLIPPEHYKNGVSITPVRI
jgi:hypothetical protein